MDSSRLLDLLSRLRFLAIGTIALIMYVGGALELEGANDWHYFTWGSDVLFGERRALLVDALVFEAESTGLHLYAEHGFIQIGPPALLLAKLLQVGPGEGLYVAGAVVQLLGLVLVYLVDRAFRQDGSHAGVTVLVAGAFVTVVWGSLTHFTHLDDALALTSVAGAVLALTRDRWTTMGFLLGCAAATKPWAVVALALVLVAPTWAHRFRSALATVGVVLAFWGPFVVADLGTLAVGTYHLPAVPESPLAILGLADAAGSSLLRPGQFAIGLGVATFLVLRGRWELALVAGFTARLLFDPNVYSYYTAALVVSALVADLAVVRFRIPVFTSLVMATWLSVQIIDSTVVAGWLRVISYIAVIALALAFSRRPVAPRGHDHLDSRLAIEPAISPAVSS